MSDNINALTRQIRELGNEIEASHRKLRTSLDDAIREIRDENETSFRQIRKEFIDNISPSTKPDPSEWAKSWAEIRSDFGKLEVTIKELGGEVVSSKKEGDAKLNTAVSALKTEANALGEKITQLGEKVKVTPTFSEVPGALLDFLSKHWRMIFSCLSVGGFLVWVICNQFTANQDAKLSSLEKAIANNDQRLGKIIDAMGQDLKAVANQPTALELRISKELVERESRFYGKLDLLTDRMINLEIQWRDHLPSSGGSNSTNKSGAKNP